MKKYQDAQLIISLQTLAKQIGRTPSYSDIYAAMPNIADPGVFRRSFGSLRAAQMAAGLIANTSGGQSKYSDEDLLEWLRVLGRRRGYIPTLNDVVKAHDLPDASVYVNRFGTINVALRRAGIQFNPWRLFARQMIGRMVRSLMNAAQVFKEPWNAHNS